MNTNTQPSSNFHWDWNLPRLFIRRCREKGARIKVADSSGVKLSGNDLLLRTLALKRIIDREVLQSRFKSIEDEKHVGVLLPPTVPAVVVNMALTLSRRVAVNLNYTVSESIINRCIEQAQIKHVLTSRKVMEKLGMNLNAQVVYLEDLKDKATLGDKIVAFTQSKLMPEGMLASQFQLHKNKPDDRLTIIFTSGSTGIPKGVPLTFNNIASNVQGFDATIHVKEDDCFLGILPFFHSFGYTGTLWAVGCLPCSGAFHYNPLEPKQIAKLIETYKCTIVLGTPTFLRGFLKRIEPQQFKTVDVVVVGAEKMPIPLAQAFEERFGVRPIEGYGTTELSPVVAVNVPPSRARTLEGKNALREGSVGKPIPGVHARAVSLEDHSKVLGPDQSGMIEISGPNVMQGYLNQPELTAKVMNNGWYITGDVGFVDADGFIHITGRESRFSKIGGEMVPHIQIEEELNKIVGGDEDILKLAVCGVPDEKKGEKIIVLYTELPEEPDAIIKKLIAAGLPSIYIPSPDGFIKVDAIPILGTGKLDLRGLQTLAKEKA
ncbi:MAG: AMP-binding protein [Planctomycetaceae bacterium]|jgi:acyl-[acyl-carrier-protein]-phospholipid O-acyltransferase/long-chain-fatty-acid--[acyl-carrier-protein] ligase|nr:AMP-binding protein [Planctomycetaceae bacterium]